MISATNVASAAPGTPMERVKMRKGSQMTLKMLAKELILTGVTVSRVPRNAEKPTKEINDGRNANERIKR